MTNRYVVTDGDRWYYYLVSPEDLTPGAVPHFDGQPAERAQRTHWWSAPSRPASAEWVHSGISRLASYSLVDSAAASERFPLILAPQEYAERTRREDAAEWSLYKPVYEPGPELRRPLDLSGLVLLETSAPVQSPGNAYGPDSWHAALPTELSQHVEYRHLFPGYLTGFQKAMQERLKALPGVEYVLEGTHGQSRNPDGTLEVTVRTPYEPKRTEHRPALNLDGSRSRARKGYDVELSYAARRKIRAPYRVDGPNLAAAVATWDAWMSEAVATVQAMTELIMCGHCEGTGIIGTQADSR